MNDKITVTLRICLANGAIYNPILLENVANDIIGDVKQGKWVVVKTGELLVGINGKSVASYEVLYDAK